MATLEQRETAVKVLREGLDEVVLELAGNDVVSRQGSMGDQRRRRVLELADEALRLTEAVRALSDMPVDSPAVSPSSGG